MRRKLFLFFILMSAAIFLCLSLAAHAMDTPGADILKAATQGFKPYIDRIPDGRLANFGFGGKMQADAAVLGQAFHVYTAPPFAILDDKANDIGALAVPTSMWEFLIMSEGKGVALLTVDKTGAGWDAVSIGSSLIAEQLSTLMETWPVAEGYEYRFITIFQGSSHFVEIFHAGRSMGVVPLSSARVAMGLSAAFTPKELLSAETVVKMMQPAVRANLGQGALH
jgi:hypothetical protein